MTDKNEKKLKKLFALLDDDTLTREEFVQNWELVINEFKKFKGEMSKVIDELGKTHQNSTKALTDGNTKEFSTLKAELLKLVSNMSEKLEARIASIKDGEDGKDADEAKIVQDVLAQIKLPEYKEVILPSAKETRDALESLEGEDRVDHAYKQSLEERLAKMETWMSRPVPVARQMRMAPFEFTGDGVTATFVLPKVPAAKGHAIWAFLNGQEIQRGTHYTVAGKTLTTLFTPATGDTIEGLIILF